MTITSFFTNNGIAATGLVPTIVIYLTETGAVAVSDVMTETGNGWYKYDFTETVDIAYDFVCDAGNTIPIFERKKVGSFITQSTSGGITTNDILNMHYEGTETFKSLLEFLRAFIIGTATGGGTTVLTFKGADGTTTRIQMTVDGNGNRSLVQLTP